MTRSLQFRVARALVLIVGVVCGLSTLATTVVSDWLEDAMMREITKHEAEAFADALRQGKIIEPPSAAYLHVFVVDGPNDPDLPEGLRGIPVGHQDDVAWRDGTFQVYRQSVAGRWLYVAYDVTAIENREDAFSMLLWVNVLAALLLAAAAGFLAARLTVAPISRLAERVRTLPAEARGLRLTGEFNTPETTVIAAAFDRYLARLDELIERERNFTTDASHELRTPLAVIRSTAELILSRAPADTRMRTQIERIRRSAEQMSELTEALLMLAREADSDEYVRIDAILHSLLTDPSLPAEAGARLRLDIDSQLAVQAARAAVATVVHNLVRNALRHAPQGEVLVRLRGRQLEVSDHGPGVPAGLRERAFERGFQTGPAAGLGFGLYISKRLCERFGWQIRLTEAAGGGTLAIVKF